MEIVKVNKEGFKKALLKAGVKETEINMLKHIKYIKYIKFITKNINIVFTDSEV